MERLQTLTIIKAIKLYLKINNNKLKSLQFKQQINK